MGYRIKYLEILVLPLVDALLLPPDYNQLKASVQGAARRLVGLRGVEKIMAYRQQPTGDSIQW